MKVKVYKTTVRLVMLSCTGTLDTHTEGAKDAGVHADESVELKFGDAAERKGQKNGGISRTAGMHCVVLETKVAKLRWYTPCDENE